LKAILYSKVLLYIVQTPAITSTIKHLHFNKYVTGSNKAKDGTRRQVGGTSDDQERRQKDKYSSGTFV